MFSDRLGYTLFLYTIGPVQSFIATARKTQDLWAGSFLLSYLVHIGLECAAKSGGRVIFPYYTSSGSTLTEQATLPNRFLLVLTDKTEEDIKQIGYDTTEAINNAFINIMAYGCKQFSDMVSDINNQELLGLFQRQSRDFLETYWVALPLPKTASDYKVHYSAIESALTGRKNLKLFGQTKPEGLLKCSMCGEREAVHPGAMNTIGQIKEFWKKISKKDHRFGSGDYLCAICMGKRLAADYFKEFNIVVQNRFPSTGEVAASPYKEMLLRDHGEAYKSFEENAQKKKLGLDGCMLPKIRKNGVQTVDGHWLFEDNYTKREFQGYREDLTQEDIYELTKALRRLRTQEGIKNIRPSPYYAILIMDGDKMGERLSQVNSEEEHTEFSNILANFAAQETKKIVEQDHLGKIVYSGGDDLLVLVSIDCLLDVMEKLRTTFTTIMNNKFPHIGGFSTSCGVCISHYKNPLSITIQKARDMEKMAKQNEDILLVARNAFGIEVLSHSGNNKRAVARWERPINDSTIPLIPDLNQLKDLIREKALSNKFIYVMKREFDTLLDRDGCLISGLANYTGLVSKEFARLMWRAVDQKHLKEYLEKRSAPGATPEAKYALEHFAERLLSAYKDMNYNLQNFVSLLEIVNVISREAIS